MTVSNGRATPARSVGSSQSIATSVGVIAAILVAIMLNNIDRQMLSLIKPLLDAEFGWSALDYGRVAAASQLAAALCLPVMGWIVDMVSARRCFGWAVAAWSMLTAAQALAIGTQSMLAIRVALMGAEAMGTPAALKVLGSLTPRPRRALALGLFNMAPSVGAMIGPLLVPLLAWSLGWRWAAVIVGGLGFAWLAWWLRISRTYKVPAARLECDGHARVSLGQPAIWLLVAAKALTDQLWWVFLYWLPAFFHARGSGEVSEWAGSITSIYVLAVLGSLAGALAASRWQHSHKMGTTLSIAACCLGVVAMLLIATAPDLALSVVACALAIFGHQILSVLIFSEISDDRFRARTGMIGGIAAFAGNLLAVVSVGLVGKIVAGHADFATVFIFLALAYLAGGVCLIEARRRMRSAAG